MTIPFDPAVGGTIDELCFGSLWLVLFEQGEVRDSDWRKYLAKIKKMYAEPPNNKSVRAYHSLEHVDKGFAELLKFTENDPRYTDTLSRDMREIELAWWFHDAIYKTGPDVRPRTNEMESSAFARQVLAEASARSHLLITVDNLIMATCHTGDALDHKEQIICDVDLSGLGKPFEQFIENSPNIRKEFGHLDDKTFYAGNCKFLMGLASRARIFYTDFFFDLYEKQARKNIEDYANKLKAERILE